MADVRSKASIPIVADFISRDGAGTDIICDTTAGIAYFLNGLNVVTPIGANYAYSDEQVRDAVAAAFAAGTQTGLTITYDDPNDKFSFTVGADVRNFILNGGMDIWQRGTSFVNPTTVSNATFYGPDRWGCNRTGNVAGVSISRQASPTGGRYSLLQQRTAGDTSTAVIASYYTLETADSIFLQGKTVTFSVWAIKAGTYSGGNWTLTLITGTGTDERVYAFTGSATAAASGNTLTTSWTRYSVTGAIPSTATEVGVTLTWTPSGTAGASDAVFFTQAQLEVGSTPTAYVARPFVQELLMCQRYYQKAFHYATVPANGTNDYGDASVACNNINSTATTSCNPRFVPELRVIPTMTIYNPRAGGATGRYSNGVVDDTGVMQIFNTNTKGVSLVSNSLVLTSGTWYTNWTADADL